VRHNESSNSSRLFFAQILRSDILADVIGRCHMQPVTVEVLDNPKPDALPYITEHTGCNKKYLLLAAAFVVLAGVGGGIAYGIVSHKYPTGVRE
jgi:hypothetical protein